ncbi:hypothetical protein [Mucilaginibacter antarcticus]|uniref:hypothetical protein n=1 Tax=Mucilaginibacter antarcticus TaxID=1855725 RepID=UPI00362541F0
MVEQFGYQMIINAFFTNNAALCKALTAAYLKKFPAGVYIADVKAKARKFK